LFHQHSFIAGEGIQKPSLLATHLIKDAQKSDRPLQLISLDPKKVFDQTSHYIIIQAHRAFRVPEKLIQAFQNYIRLGYAKLEVNGQNDILITIKTGSGQGDLLSSIIFHSGSEPLKKQIVTKFLEIMYVTSEEVTVGPILFSDDNLQRTEQLEPLLVIYD
jgi:hypothetical protein